MWLGRLKSRRRPAEPAEGPARSQEVVLVCHGADASGLNVMRNASAALDAARIPFTVIDLAFGHPWPPLRRFSAMVVCTDRLASLGSRVDALLDWVADGGGVLFAIRGWSPELAPLLGLVKPDAPMLTDASGLVFVADVAPGADGLVVEPEDWLFPHKCLNLRDDDLSPDCQILVRDLAGGPLAWRYLRQAGRVVVWNTQLLQARVLRGFLLQGIFDAMGTAAAAIGGCATLHIDDFPPPLSSDPATHLEPEFPGMDISGFYFGPWLQDMLALRRKHDLRYSWYSVMDYSDETGRPPKPDQLSAGRRVLAERFARTGALPGDDEIGFHGYNHRRANAQESPDLTLYRAQLQAARAMWIDHVPAPLPRSWVPAGNHYTAAHVRAVSEVFPEIETVASLHAFGAPEVGEFREFGPEPWCPHLLCFPRNNFGCFLGPKQKLLLLSQIASHGIWSHFLHPDDVFDVPVAGEGTADLRNPLGLLWKQTDGAGRPGLFRGFEAFVGHVCETFPWLRFVTTSEAAAIQRRKTAARPRVSIGRDRIAIDCSAAGTYFLRTSGAQRLDAREGEGRLLGEHPVAGGRLWVVDCPAGQVVFRLAGDGQG